MALRKWQSEFLDHYSVFNGTEYLLVATPAAGKTRAALYAVSQKFHTGIVDKVIVVCPTESLKYQWASSAVKLGIDLFPRYTDGLIKSDYDGICLTYAKVIHSIRMLDHICRSSRILVILDEIHHSADNLAWGDSIRAAVGNARYILGLSGTPFRGDNNTIPFVKYERGVAVPNFSYNYGEAIKDKVCRKMMFPTLDGGAEFYHKGEIHRWDSFTDVVGNKEESQLLRAILYDTEGEYIRGLLTDAHKRLIEIRDNGDLSAGGLIIAMTVSHANKIAEVIYQLTGVYPVIVHSDIEGNSIIEIEHFAQSLEMWIVAVRMISEGVDIPRLRVGVYATNIIQELTFRQIVGRFVRRTNDFDDWSYLYVPLHSRLIEYMKRIKEEITHVLESEPIPRLPRDDYPPNKEREPSLFVPLGTDRNPDEDLVISDDITYKFNAAKVWRDKIEDVIGVKLNEWQGAKIIEMWEGGIDTNDNSEENVEPIPIHIKEKQLRIICNKSAYSLACRIEATNNTSKEAGDIVKSIHYVWSRISGNGKQSEASIKELERKIEWLNSGETEADPERFL